MNKQFFRKLWNYGRSGEALSLPSGIPGVEVHDELSWAIYERFLESFWNRTKVSPPGIVPTTASFDQKDLVSGGLEEAASILRPFVALTVLTEFCVRVHVSVDGAELADFLLDEDAFDDEQTLFCFPGDLSWCVAQSHDQEWFKVTGRDEGSFIRHSVGNEPTARDKLRRRKA